MELGLLVLRDVVGLLFVGHGAQKLFGFFGGALLALGLFTPFAAAALIGTMAVAIATVHWSKGVWTTEGGYEYNAVLMAVAFAVTAVGPGNWSLDHELGFDIQGAGWALAALAAGIVGGLGMIAVGRSVGARAEQQH